MMSSNKILSSRVVALSAYWLEKRARFNQMLERVTGIEPAFSAWEADVLPLNYTRKLFSEPAEKSNEEPAQGADLTTKLVTEAIANRSQR